MHKNLFNCLSVPYIIFFLAFNLLFLSAYSQKTTRIEILHADELEIDQQMDQRVRKLKGNVQLRQENLYLYCDEATFYETQNKINAFGNVHIRKSDSVNAYADKLLYNGNTKVAELFDNIILTDNKMQLTTDHLIFNTAEDIAFYTHGGKLIDKENTLTSKHGYYYTQTNDIYFKKDVHLDNPNYTIICDTLKYNTKTEIVYFIGPSTIYSQKDTIYCEYGWYNSTNETSEFTNRAWVHSNTYRLSGDTLYYDKKAGLGVARGKTEWIDSSGTTIINGNFAEYFETENKTLITKNPVMTSVMKNDSLFLAADTLLSTVDSARHRIFYAYNNVKIFRKDFQAICDSVVYSFKDSTFRLYNDPVIWMSNTQMFSDTIIVYLKNNKIDRFHLQNAAFLISEEEGELFNQMKGKDLFGIFKNDSLYKLIIKGNGQSTYYAKDDSGAYIGVNRAECSDIILYFKNNKADKIYFMNEPDATFFPMAKVNPEELKYMGFLWLKEKKPNSKYDLFYKRTLLK